MKRKITIFSIAAAVILILGYLLFIKRDSTKTKFIFAKITRGDVSNTITSTGTLQAVTTVDVGTQVSGKIDKILVDFNYNVKKGQLLAILDTTNLALQVSNAVSGLQKAQAQNDVSKATYDRDTTLYNKNFISQLDFITSKSNYQTAKANLISAQTSLSQAKTSLGYAFIYSPIKGKIINRNVEEGQTVAASLSAPTLFTIAEDLSKMQILADVDESDIGQIKVGQESKFNVQAYPEKEFSGKVVQIRLGSTVISNVVNYVVVINADNNDGLLLPGMTATIDFYVQEKDSVLLVPNSALRFQPSEDLLAQYSNPSDTSKNKFPDSLKNKYRKMRSNGQNFGSRKSNTSMQNKSFGRVWDLDEKGNLKSANIVLGLTDGKNTEIVRGRNLKENMNVITGILSDDEAAKAPASNLLNPNQGMPRNVRRGF